MLVAHGLDQIRRCDNHGFPCAAMGDWDAGRRQTSKLALHNRRLSMHAPAHARDWDLHSLQLSIADTPHAPHQPVAHASRSSSAYVNVLQAPDTDCIRRDARMHVMLNTS